VRAPAIVLVLAAAVGCDQPDRAARIDLDLIVIERRPALRTSPIGGAPDPAEVRAYEEAEGGPMWAGTGKPIEASYVLVDAENRSPTDAAVTLGGTLTGAAQTAPLRRESLFVPAGGTRTFLLLDQGLAPRPWATGVEVKVTGAVEARHRPAFEIADVHQLPDGDRVVVAASVTSTAKRAGTVIVLAAFHDADGAPLSRGHTFLRLLPGEPQTVRFVGPPGSVRGTIFQGESVF
jgi:hypothetical protein